MQVAGIYLGDPLADRLDPDPEEPIGLEYVLSALAKDGHDVSLLSQWHLSESLSDHLCRMRPDAILIQVYTRDVPNAISLAKDLKTKLPDVLIVAGGYHPTALPLDFLLDAEGAIDICIVGEGEETTRLLLRDAPGGRSELFRRCDGMAGLAYLDGDTPCATEGRPLIRNLNSLPWPLREPKYYDLPTGGFYYPEATRLRYAPVVYSRGCFGKCEFCSSAQTWGRRTDVEWERVVRFRDPVDVVREMNDVHREHGVNFFFMEDLSINVDDLRNATNEGPRDHLFSLCEAMREFLSPEIHWGCCANVGITQEQLKELKTTRCVCLSYGIETLNAHTLRRIGKRQRTVAEIADTLTRAAELGIINYGFYMIGFDEDTEESIQGAAYDLAELPIHRLRVTFATPLPGSAWFERIQENGKSTLLSDNWGHFDTQHPVILNHRVPPGRLAGCHQEMLRTFYSSRSYQRNIKALLKVSPHLKRSYEEFRAWLRRKGTYD